MRRFGFTPLQTGGAVGPSQTDPKSRLAPHEIDSRNQFVTGYTLIETIVVVAMMAIIGTIALASYQGGRERNRVYAAALEVATTIREAQQHALAGTVENAPGYGVRFWNNDSYPSELSYPLYADVDNDAAFSTGDEPLTQPIAVHDATITFKTYCDSLSQNYIDIVFNPPHPTSQAHDNLTNSCDKVCVVVQKGSNLWRVDTDILSGVTNLTENQSTCN